MKLKSKIAAALGASLLLGGCETTDWGMVSDALSLYSDVAYVSGDCPFGLHKTYDRDGHHHCLGEPGTHTDRHKGDGHDQHYRSYGYGDAAPAEEKAS